MSKEKYELEVRERILKTARELFVKNGYNGTSIRDIAAVADVNVAHINYYFGSKYGLFEIIFDEAFDKMFRRIELILSSDLPITELVERWINVYYEVLAENPLIPMFILNEANHGSDKMIEIVKKHQPIRLFNNLQTKFEAEIKLGTIQNIPTLDFVINVLSLSAFPFMLSGLVMKVTGKTYAEYSEILDTHRRYVVEFVLNALKINEKL
ncbi:MAG: TetR family transcriptional regulator [Prevotellaceae bacterium]|jgi:AcrR family transcriptional regulator|nr:TetR family transcriptional regulator [Prevotellaceae bacterium]